jgi:hypothetical protein
MKGSQTSAGGGGILGQVLGASHDPLVCSGVGTMDAMEWSETPMASRVCVLVVLQSRYVLNKVIPRYLGLPELLNNQGNCARVNIWV